jgi:ABC-type cobalamin/Fe3+-siderophores transport system ATPase subunit
MKGAEGRIAAGLELLSNGASQHWFRWMNFNHRSTHRPFLLTPIGRKPNLSGYLTVGEILAHELVLDSSHVQKLTQLVDESVRASREGVKHFVEPTPGVLAKAKSRRHNIIFGRRGSGKSSLLQKISADLTIDRTPIALVDLETFKQHSYPDVLLSILIKSLSEFKSWLDTAATNPASKTTFWKRLFGSVPTKPGFNRATTRELSEEFGSMIGELNDLLLAAEEQKVRTTGKDEQGNETKAGLSVKSPVLGGEASASFSGKESSETQSEYTSRKVEALHRNIMRYQQLFVRLSALANGPSFLLLDDLYHLRLADQANVIDYFHRIAKGSNLWLKVGTIRHRSRWYVLGNPPTGMKLGDDADEIDLDVTLEKYDVSKAFLMRVLSQFATEAGVDLPAILADGARDRLVLASGGVARDFLTIFNRSIQVARERLISGKTARGDKVGSEDVNVAAGQQGVFKEEDFNRDTGTTEDRDRLMSHFHEILDFCTRKTKANCILIEKDISSSHDTINAINELVDLKFLHRAKFRVTVRDRVGRLYDAYMLDLSQYTGERARRDFEMVKFWGPGSDDALRKASLIYLERDN